MIRFEQVTRRYEAGGRPALDDVTVEFYREDFAFLIGASGSGKSTLLRMILREGLPQRGKVTVAGQNLGLMLDRRVPDFRRSIGMVFQDFRLLPDKTVFDNVAFAMRVLGAKRSVIRKRVTKVLDKVDLAHLAKRYPHEISGGEQQRAAIARAIVNDPAILLADEPTGNLDPRASAEVMKVLRWINASGTTVIMATHDRAIVDQAETRVVQLHHGRVVRDEPHGSYDAPEGSEAWDVLAREESESGLRAHDPAPAKTGMLPVMGSSDEHQSQEHQSQEDQAQKHQTQEHHTWEPDTEDHDFVESRDDAIDHVGDHPQDQVMAPGEDPSVLAYDEDPVLRETAPVDSTEELAALDLDDEAHQEEPVAEHPSEHEHEHEHEQDFAEEDPAPVEDVGLQVTWPEHLRDDAQGHDVPELHGDFDGTEMPDLEQDGYAEIEDGPGGVPEDELAAEPAHETEPDTAEETPSDHHLEPEDADRGLMEPPTGDRLTGDWPTEEWLNEEPLDKGSLYEEISTEEALTGEFPAVSEPDVTPFAAPDQSQSEQPTPSAPGSDGDALDPVAPGSGQPARPRLSWLAHADEDAGSQAAARQPARPAFTLDPPTREPFTQQASRPEHVTLPEESLTPEPEPVPEPARESEFEPGPEVETQPQLPSEPEEPRPVSPPKSSASQSTSTEARRTAEQLGLPRARRSIMRRLRRDR
ncbi:MULTISPECIES: cell division ATP-binding protein FtsE [unclassified Nesterenkonia]|uniref:cell division ATP-binding protein FtsE n=1 Tax=unclassified Nesterenkonia TaxID=2629769 RepID=UPI0021063821|nr:MULTISPECIES: cell division ATP-binding protein FtsE [unclassified Nesterenkonia]